MRDNPKMGFGGNSNRSNNSNRSDSNISPNNKNKMKWQWKDDNNNFVDYDDISSNQMEILYQNKGKIYKYKNPHNGQVYTIKFNDLKQYNEKTKGSRDIRRVPVSMKSAYNDPNLSNYNSGP